MPKQVKFRRGTTVQHSSFTGAEGEVTYDTTKKTLVAHDGVTAGGIPLARETNLYQRPVDNVSANQTLAESSNRSQISLHSNSGTTAANLTTTYNLTDIAPIMGRELTIFLTSQKGATAAAYANTIVVQIAGTQIISWTPTATSAAAINYNTFVLRYHPVSQSWAIV